MQKFELFDETFDPDRTESYELSIQVSLNGFSFCIKDVTRKQYIGLVSFPFGLAIKYSEDWPNYVKQVLTTFPWLSNSFKRVLFCYESPSCTIVPKDFFEPQKAKQFLNTIHSIDPLDEIWYNNLQNELVSIFNIPSTLVSYWLTIQKKTRFIGFCDPALCYHRLSTSHQSFPMITLSLSEKFSVVIISKSSRLLHCGSVEAQVPEDIVYHLLNICQKLKLATGDISVKLLGNVYEEERLESLIDRFFKSVKQASTIEQNYFSYLLSKHKVKFANLFNQSLCE